MSERETVQIEYIGRRYGAETARLVRDACREAPPSAPVEPFVALRRLQRMADAKRYAPPSEDEDMRTNTD